MPILNVAVADAARETGLAALHQLAFVDKDFDVEHQGQLPDQRNHDASVQSFVWHHFGALDPEDICHVSSDPSCAEHLLRSRVGVAVADGYRSQPDLDPLHLGLRCSYGNPCLGQP